MYAYGLGYSVVIIFIYKQQNSIVCVLLCSVVNVCIDLSYLKTNLKDKFVEIIHKIDQNSFKGSPWWENGSYLL